MISKQELDAYAKLRGIKNRGHAEKDYVQNILLFIVYQKYGKELVFKGGTALYKCFGLDRFSEDLDFTAEKEVDAEFIDEGLKRFRIEYEKSEERFERSKSIVIRIKGPLYNGSRNSLCNIYLDISYREKVIEKPEIKKLGRFLDEIPTFDVYVMAEKEILAEKIRAIVTRNKARDVYDLWFLLKGGAALDTALITKKFEYEKKVFKRKEFFEAVKEKEAIWTSELSAVVVHVPEFRLVFEEIKKKIEDKE